MDPNSGIEPLLLLAKSARGAGCREAISAPDVHVFGELLDLPQILELQGGPHETYLELLKIFAFGTYPDFRANESSLPRIEEEPLRKLKLLTIVTIANRLKEVPYSILQDSLKTETVRELEDLIIEGIYRGLIGAKLDQKQQLLNVEWTFGRDVMSTDLDPMISLIGSWHQNCKETLNTLRKEMSRATSAKIKSIEEKRTHDEKVKELETKVRQAVESEIKSRD
eukprot:gene4445-6695_t